MIYLYFRNNCDEFRPLISQMKEAEARKAQLAQMKDNENKKESEREIERFWHEIMLKEIAAKVKYFSLLCFKM